MPIRMRMSPAAKVRLPSQSIFAGVRTPRSSSFMYAKTVPKRPKGTETKNTRRHSTGARRPPSTRPMKPPAIAATL